MHPILPYLSRYRQLIATWEGEMSETKIEYVVADETTDAPSATVDVVADVGNGRTAILVIADGMTREVIMPSSRSLRGASSYQLFARRELPAGSWSSLKADEHIITRNGIEHFVGRLAVEEASAASDARNSATRYTDGWTLDFLFAGIARALPRATTITARIITGVPAELWAEVQADVAKTIKGKHSYSYNGRDVTLRVTDVQVLREGQAAWKVLPEGQREGKTFLFDIGDGTANILQIVDGDVRKSVTLPLGVGTILDDLDNTLLGKGWRKLTGAERIDLMNAMRDGNNYSYTVDNHARRVDELARAQFTDAAETFVQVIRSKLPLDQADHLWLIGGGVYFLGDTLQTLLPALKVARTSPEMLNVQGYAASIGIAKKGKARR